MAAAGHDHHQRPRRAGQAGQRRRRPQHAARGRGPTAQKGWRWVATAGGLNWGGGEDLNFAAIRQRLGLGQSAPLSWRTPSLDEGGEAGTSRGCADGIYSYHAYAHHHE